MPRRSLTPFTTLLPGFARVHEFSDLLESHGCDLGITVTLSVARSFTYLLFSRPKMSPFSRKRDLEIWEILFFCWRGCSLALEKLLPPQANFLSATNAVVPLYGWIVRCAPIYHFSFLVNVGSPLPLEWQI